MNESQTKRGRRFGNEQGSRRHTHLPMWGRMLLEFSLLVTACSSGPPLAPRAPAAQAEGVVVSTLPPPAPPEEIPSVDTQRGLVWMDGCWEWSVGRWVWVRGGWVDMPQGGAYFTGKINLDQKGGLVWSPCTWVVGGKSVGMLRPTIPARYPVSARSVMQ